MSSKELKPIYLVCGVPGSGKTWVCRQLIHKFTYVPQDFHYNDQPEALVEGAIHSDKPIITECPFGERVLKEDLEKRGLKIIPIFIVENPEIVRRRYEAREEKECPSNVYTRAATILNRALEWEAFYGTSTEVWSYLNEVELMRN